MTSTQQIANFADVALPFIVDALHWTSQHHPINHDSPG